jgi:hypothetical protein
VISTPPDSRSPSSHDEPTMLAKSLVIGRAGPTRALFSWILQCCSPSQAITSGPGRPCQDLW